MDFDATHSVNPVNFEYTDEFFAAFELMETTRQCLFITGKAGSGKSTLLHYFQRYSRKKFVVLAPTGVAALNVGGTTLHAFFRWPPRPLQPHEIKMVSRQRRKIYQHLDSLIIDEVSMVRADLLDMIDRFLRLNGRHRDQPFGGIQMIFIGDLFQLPPVVSSYEEQQLFTTVYQTPFFFSAQVLTEISLKTVTLSKLYRQHDPELIQLLNAIRGNQVTAAQLAQLNQRCQLPLNPTDAYITLTTTNKVAHEINNAHLKQLSTPAHSFTARLQGQFDQAAAPTEMTLTLKEGAQVMLVKNDPRQRWVNGTLAHIKKLKSSEIQVETIDHCVYSVEPVIWEQFEYQFDAQQHSISAHVIGSLTQYPLRLASAITIHKSQGKTFDNLMIDLGRGAFAHGQLYVALSRGRSFNGIFLKRPVRAQDIIVDTSVLAFVNEHNAVDRA
ncbi:MAG: AAA family ATPase [Pseudomonadota bacterium]|nr:AAA family ATPase [Pseudomonadota bacterium]